MSLTDWKEVQDHALGEKKGRHAQALIYLSERQHDQFKALKSPIYSAEALSELGLEQRKLEKALQVIKKENQTFDDQVELSKQRPLFY